MRWLVVGQLSLNHVEEPESQTNGGVAGKQDRESIFVTLETTTTFVFIFTIRHLPLHLLLNAMSDIVSRLVRAAASIPTDISDTDLDRHVAELLAREAKEKEGKWKELGLSAYLDSSGRGSERWVGSGIMA
jgi:hypothetical protein